MPPKNVQSLPFLTRDMLAFEHGLTLSLRIRTQATSAQNITIRGLTREGVFTLTHLPNSDKTTKEEDFRIPDVPIMLSVTNAGGTYIKGQCFASIGLVVNGDILYELGAGFIHSAKGISYPVTNLAEPGPEGGSLQSLVGTNPAAGAEISETVPTTLFWKIRSIRFQLVTSATATGRRVHLVIDTGAGDNYDMFCEIDQNASDTQNYSCIPVGATPDSQDGNDIIIPIPSDLILNPGAIIKTITTNLQAGDNFGPPILFVEEFYRLQP